MIRLNKLKQGDKVAVVSPSFAAPGKWPHVYQLGLKRLREDFGQFVDKVYRELYYHVTLNH